MKPSVEMLGVVLTTQREATNEPATSPYNFAVHRNTCLGG